MSTCDIWHDANSYRSTCVRANDVPFVLTPNCCRLFMFYLIYVIYLLIFYAY